MERNDHTNPPENEEKGVDSINQESINKISGRVQRTRTYIELYRITTEFLSKLVLPFIILFVVFTFKPTIENLLSKTTKAEFAGAKWEFAQKLEDAVKQGDTEKAEEIYQEFRKKTNTDTIRRYWKPDGKNRNIANEKRLKQWMGSNGLSTEPGRLTMFLYGTEYNNLREKAIRDLGLAE